MYITYVSYSNQDLLKVHALNKYHHQNILMSSHYSRGLITKGMGFFCCVPEN